SMAANVMASKDREVNLILIWILINSVRSAEADEVSPEGFRIEGRVSVPGTKAQEWMSLARLLVDGGEFTAQLRTDGSFIVHNIPSGSYVVEVASPNFKFDPVRVDITSKGKIRARKVNYIKSSEVVSLPYPLRLRVLMMAVPLLIIFLLPKVVNTNDPEMRKEMEQSMNMLSPNKDLPDVSELMTRFFTSKKSSKSSNSNSGGGKGSKPSALKRR
uniref:Endoplasmic reticulum membrane protein complex subunit 7 n=1 Tax=Eptatretus burgeri TaxID=7764 RepID=A0A8C4R3K6_EPTBU